jgi:hypothetical protein
MRGYVRHFAHDCFKPWGAPPGGWGWARVRRGAPFQSAALFHDCRCNGRAPTGSAVLSAHPHPPLAAGTLGETVVDGKPNFPKAYNGQHVWEYFAVRTSRALPEAAGGGGGANSLHRGRGWCRGRGRASRSEPRSRAPQRPHALGTRRRHCTCQPAAGQRPNPALAPTPTPHPQKDHPDLQEDFNDAMQSMDGLGLGAIIAVRAPPRAPGLERQRAGRYAAQWRAPAFQPVCTPHPSPPHPKTHSTPTPTPPKDYDWKRFRRYLDIGGASGSVLNALLAHNPKATGERVGAGARARAFAASPQAAASPETARPRPRRFAASPLLLSTPSRPLPQACCLTSPTWSRPPRRAGTRTTPVARGGACPRAAWSSWAARSSTVRGRGAASGEAAGPCARAAPRSPRRGVALPLRGTACSAAPPRPRARSRHAAPGPGRGRVAVAQHPARLVGC